MIGPTFLPFMITVFGAASVPFAILTRRWTRRKALTRNSDARCAHCSMEFELAASEVADAYLVDGILVCPACAALMRRRTIAAGVMFLGLAAGMFYIAWWPFIGAVQDFGFVGALGGLTQWGWALFLPPVVLLCAADWTVRRMKMANVRALDAIARVRLIGGGGEPRSVHEP